MRAMLVAAVAAALATGGCTRTRACRAGTVFVHVDARAVAADSVQVTLTIDGAVKGTSAPYALPAGKEGTLEIDLRGDYQAGRSVTVDADALAGGAIVAHASAGKTLPAGCATLSLAFDGGGTSGGGDMSASPTDAAHDLSGLAFDLTTGLPVPSHAVGEFDVGAPDAPAGITAIDTKNLTIAINGGTPASDANFKLVGANAVYYVHDATFDAGKVTITGDKPFVLVAAGSVDIQGELDASAKTAWSPGSTGTITPGPGGFGPGAGPGAGKAGVSGSSNVRWGGGGASFGSAGGAGGGFGTPTGNDGLPGAVYGGTLADFQGGSGGGSGYHNGTCPENAQGGAGGGAVQISSAAMITVEAGGGIDVGGSGGVTGCGAGDDGAGGGGSGGLVFLEAPTIKVAGKLTANGGGGSSGKTDIGDWDPGDDGAYATTPAPGGTTSNAGSGGDGAAGATPAKAGACAGAGGCGGGGGGAGRIWLHTHGTQPDTIGATFSPTPTVDMTF